MRFVIMTTYEKCQIITMSQFTLNQRVKVNPTELLWLAYVSESQLNSSLSSAFCHQHQLLSSSSNFFIVIDDNKRALPNARRGQGSHLLSQRAVEKSNISQRSALALLQKPFTLVIGNSLVSTRSKVRSEKYSGQKTKPHFSKPKPK